MEQNVDLPVPQVVGKIFEVIKDTPQERISQRFRRLEQIVHVRMPRILEEIVEVIDVPVLQIQEGIVEVIEVIPAERISGRILEQIAEMLVPVPRILEEIVAQIADVPSGTSSVFFPGGGVAEHRNTPLCTACCSEPLTSATNKWDTAK